MGLQLPPDLDMLRRDLLNVKVMGFNAIRFIAGVAMAQGPVDENDDGVCDGEDNCPEAANPGQEDADGDGIPDVDDNCMDVPNEDQTDEDGDGVYDGLGMDRCPGTPAGVEVDSHGCPLKDDGAGS